MNAHAHMTTQQQRRPRQQQPQNMHTRQIHIHHDQPAVGSALGASVQHPAPEACATKSAQAPSPPGFSIKPAVPLRCAISSSITLHAKRSHYDLATLAHDCPNLSVNKPRRPSAAQGDDGDARLVGTADAHVLPGGGCAWLENVDAHLHKVVLDNPCVALETKSFSAVVVQSQVGVLRRCNGTATPNQHTNQTPQNQTRV